MSNRIALLAGLCCVLSVIVAGCELEPSQPTGPALPETASGSVGTAPRHTVEEPIPAKWREHTQGLPFVIGYERGLEEVRARHKPAMLFITTTWCGPCRNFANDNLTDPEIRELLGNFVCVLVDGDTERRARQEMGTRGYPHIVFLSDRGEKLAEFHAYRSPQQFKAIAEAVLANGSK